MANLAGPIMPARGQDRQVSQIQASNCNLDADGNGGADSLFGEPDFAVRLIESL